MQKLFSSLKVIVLILWVFSACQVEKQKTQTAQKPPQDSCSTAYDTAYAQWLRDKANKIDSFFTAKYERRQFNGSILFADRGNVIIKKAYGYANFQEQDTLEISSAFQLASISKPLTALGILWLAEKGYLSLRDSLQTFFPQLPYSGINVEMLLSHRSGLPNYMYFSDTFWPDRQVPISNRDVLCLMQTYQPDIYYIPDYRYNYCNTNYALLASIIEEVSEMSYSQFMETYVFESLGMHDTYVYRKTLRDRQHSTVGYHRGRVAEDTYLNGVTGDKGIYSTVEDLFKLDQALYRHKFISEERSAQAFTAVHPELHDHDNYGLGWRINERPDCSKIVFHSGWWKGYRTHFLRLLDEQQTIIVLSNTNRSRFINTRDLISLLE